MERGVKISGLTMHWARQPCMTAISIVAMSATATATATDATTDVQSSFSATAIGANAA
jgi:hypothetical protein